MVAGVGSTGGRSHEKSVCFFCWSFSLDLENTQNTTDGSLGEFRLQAGELGLRNIYTRMGYRSVTDTRPESVFIKSGQASLTAQFGISEYARPPHEKTPATSAGPTRVWPGLMSLAEMIVLPGRSDKTDTTWPGCGCGPRSARFSGHSGLRRFPGPRLPFPHRLHCQI